MALSDFTIIRRSLTARLFSTVMTILTVAVAVGLMIVLLSMRQSGYTAFQRGAGNMHMIVSRDASPLTAVLNGVFFANPPQNPIPWRDYERVQDRGFSAPGSPPLPLEYAIPIQSGDSFRGFPTLATISEFFEQFTPIGGSDPIPFEFVDGRAFDKPLEVVLGSAVAASQRLGVGSKVYLTHGAGGSHTADAEEEDDEDDHAHEEDDHSHAEDEHVHADDGGHVHDEFVFEVVGVLAETGGPHDRLLITSLESSWILHAHDRRLREDPSASLTTVDDLVDDDRLITGIYVRAATRQGRAMSGGQQMVFEIFRRDPTFTVASPSDQIKKLFAIVSDIDQLFLGMAAVVMVSSAIAILLALYNSMEQRRRQIAVLRVLGASRARIFGLVLTESALIGIVGTIAGVVLAFFGAHAVALVMKERLGLVIRPELPLQELVLVAAAAVLLAALAGVIPAMVAYRTPVAKNLKPLG